MVILLMGVSGSGKTTVGKLLAAKLTWEFRDADDLHSKTNKTKMANGIALTDADRAPWLASIRDLIVHSLASGLNIVLACSALRQSYRDEIVVDAARVKVVYLKGSPELIASRIAHRTNHFMNKDLLGSQFDTLEEPRDAIVVDVGPPPEVVAAEIRRQLGL